MKKLIVLLFMVLFLVVNASGEELMQIVFNPYPPHTTTVYGYATKKEIKKCLKMGGVMRNPDYRLIIQEPYCDARGTEYEREFLKHPRRFDVRAEPMTHKKKAKEEKTPKKQSGFDDIEKRLDRIEKILKELEKRPLVRIN